MAASFEERNLPSYREKRAARRSARTGYRLARVRTRGMRHGQSRAMLQR
ncbi:hypothetical protein [Burkholderia anthina]|nr:hypothetical protein [Burkholderia anthina]